MFPIQAKSLLYEVNLIGTESGGAEQQALILQAHEFPAAFFSSLHVNIHSSAPFWSR